MSKSGNGGEPSMEEILASIRALVTQDTAQPAAQPVAPPQSAPQQRAAPVPSSATAPSPAPAPSPAQAQDRPLPVPDSRSELPHSTPPGAPASPARLDEDDLADLLDEPLPPADPPVSAPSVTPPLSADWSAGASAAGTDRAVDSGGPAPARMSFDFGAMVPTRDPAPARDSGSGSLPPLSHIPAPARPMASLGPTLANGNRSVGWPQPARAGQDAALPGGSGLASPERAGPSSNAEAALPTAPAAKSPANGAEPPAGRSPDKPVTEAAEPQSVSSAAPPSGLNKFFSAPVTHPPASALSRPLVPRSEDNTSTALAQPAANHSGDAAIPASGFEARPTPSFGTRVPDAEQLPAKESAPAAYSSIEPVLKAFGKTETKPDRPAPLSTPAPALGGVNLPENSSQASSSGSAAPASVSKSSKFNGDARQDRLGERTLEDAVMHLLRPMLREWLDDNLPRIVEDAVRREIADAVKSKIGQMPKL